MNNISISVIKIQKIWRGVMIRKNINFIICKNIFSTINITKFTKMMISMENLSDNNMNKFIKSIIRESFLNELLPKSKYVGNNSYWETDIIYPLVNNLTQKHIKLEIKCMKNLYLKNGDTQGIVIKNGRGEGQEIKKLLSSIMKNIFILIDSKSPFSISYCSPENMFFYTDKKKEGKKYSEILLDNNILNRKTAELKAYVLKKDINFLYKDLYLIDFNDNYDPINEMIKNSIDYYNKL